MFHIIYESSAINFILGGNASSDSKNGEGGYSYVTSERGLQELANVTSGANSGPGEILIIPAIQVYIIFDQIHEHK